MTRRRGPVWCAPVARGDRPRVSPREPPGATGPTFARWCRRHRPTPGRPGMRTTETRSGAASGTAGVREVDVRLEVVGSRFSDVDPAAGAPAGSLLAPLRSATGVALIAGTVLAS